MLAIAPALYAVSKFKVISDNMVASRRGFAPPFEFQQNGIMICTLIWAFCAYLVITELYQSSRDQKIDRVVFFTPLFFYALLLGLLAYRLVVDFRAEGVPGYADYSSLAVFMPAMAALGVLMFGWPYLDRILRRPRWLGGP